MNQITSSRPVGAYRWSFRAPVHVGMGAAVLILAMLQVTELFRARSLLMLSLLLLAGVATQLFRVLNSTSEKLLAAGFFLGSLMVEALPGIVTRSPGFAYELTWHANLVVLGWVFVIFILSTGGMATGWLRRRPQPAFLTALAAVMLSILIGAHFALRNLYGGNADEMSYLYASKTISSLQFSRLPVDSSFSPFFFSYFTFIRNGHLVSMYPPGWPLVLALFDKLHLRWFAPPLLGLLAVALTYLLGKQLRSRTTGLLAAALLATSYAFISLQSTYLSNVITVPLCAGAAWLLLKAEEDQHRAVWRWGLAAGFLLGLVLISRPATGVAISASLGSWLLVRKRLAWGGVIRIGCALGLGAIPAIVLLLFYNHITTGSPFELGYTAAMGSLNRLGFGLRGVVLATQAGQPTPLAGVFTPRIAVSNELLLLRDLSLEFTPLFLVAPLLYVAYHFKVRIGWRCVAPFFALPLIYFFYFYLDSRYLLELLPFLCVGMAVVLCDLAEIQPQVAHSLLLFLLAANLAFVAFRLRNDAVAFQRNYVTYLAKVSALHRERGPLLVFVRGKRVTAALPGVASAPLSDPLFTSLWWFNLEPDSDIIVARDLGPENSRAMRRWPNHLPIAISDESGVPLVQVLR
jgi:4-amino-4-deoxy-L-arabinose transferase-like glycosyltransferase